MPLDALANGDASTNVVIHPGDTIVVAAAAAGPASTTAPPDAPSERLIAAMERMPTTTRKRLAADLARLVHELGADDEPASMLFEEDPEGSVTKKPGRNSNRRA